MRRDCGAGSRQFASSIQMLVQVLLGLHHLAGLGRVNTSLRASKAQPRRLQPIGAHENDVSTSAVGTRMFAAHLLSFVVVQLLNYTLPRTGRPAATLAHVRALANETRRTPNPL